MQPNSSRPATLPAAAWLLVALLCESAAATPSAGPPEEPSAAARDDEDAGGARERRRLLHLAQGGVLRAKARRIDGHWEVRDGREWRALPPGAVVRAEDERDVLAEAKRLRRAAPETAGRVALADWMVREGLYAEALEELDRVLREEPDSEAARRLLRTSPPPVALPPVGEGPDGAPDADALLRLAAGATPSVRELAVQRLDEHRGMALLAALRAELASHSVRRREFAALALRRLFPGEGLRDLLDRAVLDGSEDVRTGASLALRDAGDTELVVPLVRAMTSAHPKVRQHSIQALGNMGYGAAVEPLMAHLAALPAAAQSSSWRPPASHIFVGRQTAYVQDYDVEVAQNASIADPQINALTEGSVLDVRVISARAESVAMESRHVRGALTQLTGADPGRTTKAWLEWWEENHEAWALANFLPPAGEAEGRTSARAASGS